MSHARVCLDNHLGRNVLIKELQPGVDQRRLLDEIAALTAIRSKHVVQLYDVVRDAKSNIVGIVEEYIPGEDLLSLVPVSDLSLFLRTAYAMACGISDIHATGRVHRDIKPNNVKFDAEGCLKIFDFGLARTGSVDAATQGAVGTTGYMAPELCVDDDQIADFDQAIDTYAFGATMLRLLAGTLPPDLRRSPPRLPCAAADFSAQSLQLPMEVAAALNRCLSFDRGDRPEMAFVRETVGAELLRDQHRAAFVVQGTLHNLSATQRNVTITLTPLGAARFTYDGLRFLVTPVTGEIFVNNVPVGAESVLPKSSVVTFGGTDRGMGRVHVPFDVSHPEVVL